MNTLQNIIKEGRDELDKSLHGFRLRITDYEGNWNDVHDFIKNILSSRTTEAYRAGLEEAMKIVDKYWKFYEYQMHRHSWHDKQDCMEKLSQELKIIDEEK